jgi:predicted acyl esterase
VVADVFASTTGTDGDFVVKLIDEYPADAAGGMGGFQSMVVEEIFRGRYRKSFEHPEAIPAGKVEEYRWSLHAADHTFLKGHRMLVTVQSTWFPLYDRNPQTFVERIPTAPAEAYKPATISIMTSEKYPSHLEVLRPTGELHGGLASGTR